jgi:peptidoglycan/xylan/chitin deacetylase (PgdA/CDA1 family)
LQRLTDKLLSHLQEYGAPGIGFVNERSLFNAAGEEERTVLLRQWLDAGMELANHTYAHVSFQTTPLEDFEADVLRGGVVTARLLEERGGRIRYFRHPYLQTGPDDASKTQFAAFLAEHELRPAPVTVGHYDWLYASAYRAAKDDSTLMRRVADTYLEFMERDIAFSEHLSREVLGYEMKQVLRLHANALNADYLGDVLAMLERRGYAFITLDEALSDPAFERGDPYTGPRGFHWLERWWFDEHGAMAKIPPAHTLARQLSGITSQLDWEQSPGDR